MKRIRLRHMFFAFIGLMSVLIVAFVILFQRNIRTAASVKKLEDGLYSMEYKGDYRLDDFLEQGGASDDIAVAEFVIQDVFHGLLPIDLRNGTFGCSTISARTAKGDAVFGRNFDWGTCNALIVQTRPADGYASVSTVNMDFLNLGLDMPEEMQMRLLSVAAPFAPMDGMNEKGLCVAVEYIANEMIVTETPIVTNYYLSPGEKYGIGTAESKIRYAMLEELLQKKTSFEMDEIRDALDSVSKHNFDSEFASTEWSIVYNQNTGEIHYYHRENYQKFYSFMAGR